VDWQESSLVQSATLRSLSTDGNLEVLVGTGGATLYSTNGTSWQPGTGGWTGPDITYNDVVWGNGVYVCVGNGRLISSTDGVVWQKRMIDTSWLLNGVTFAQNQFVAVGGSGVVITSSDGATWTQQSPATTNDLTSVTFFKGMYLVTIQPKLPNANPSPGILTSTNAVNWSPDSLVLPLGIGLTGITQDGQIALSVGAVGHIYRLGEMQQPTVSLQRDANTLQYSVAGRAGVNFTLEQSNDLGVWVPSAFILNASPTVQFRRVPALSPSQQFYRVVVK
jgi:hypothetical protein